jgi:low temperature requirement protein LtrA
LQNPARSSAKSFLTINAAITSRFFSAPKLWPAHERHVRHAGWTELFFDLVFAAAISQLSTPLGADYSLQGVGRYAFLLALVFLAWLGYAKFSTQFAVDDVLQRALIVSQVFLVAVMAANSTGPLSGTDAAGFGAAYGGVRAILALQYLCVAKLRATRSVVIRRIVGLAIAAIVWAVSAFLPAPYRYGAWALALAVDLANTWLPARSTSLLPPGATHFPERFGLLTIILLGELVASVMRGIESQPGWSVLAAAAAVLSLALGFALWSGYSDGAAGWQVRHVRSTRDVTRLRIWITLHFVLFLGIGILGIGARRGIALPPDGHFSALEQWLICSAASAIVLVIMGIAASSERHIGSRRFSSWALQLAIAAFVLMSVPLTRRMPAVALLFILFLCFVGQATFLVLNQSGRRGIGEI